MTLASGIRGSGTWIFAIGLSSGHGNATIWQMNRLPPRTEIHSPSHLTNCLSRVDSARDPFHDAEGEEDWILVKQRSKIPHTSRAPIRHAYDSVITRLARLAAFASSPLLINWGEVDQRQEDLAVDDLIALAIHVRRLLELTDRKAEAIKVHIQARTRDKTETVPITRLLNGLIHHTSLSIARRRADTLPVPTEQRPESWAEWHDAFQIRMDPVAWLSSDQIAFLAFKIEAFAEAVAMEILAPIIDYCDDNGLYLEDIDSD